MTPPPLHLGHEPDSLMVTDMAPADVEACIGCGATPEEVEDTPWGECPAAQDGCHHFVTVPESCYAE